MCLITWVDFINYIFFNPKTDKIFSMGNTSIIGYNYNQEQMRCNDCVVVIC